MSLGKNDHLAKLRMMFPLADALCATINIHKDDTLSGAVDVSLDAGNLSTTFTAKIHASSIKAGEYAAVLVKVRKRLWAYVHYDGKKESLTLLLLDAKHNAANFHEHQSTSDRVSGLTISEFIDTFADAVVAMFTRKKTDTRWAKHDFTDPVVQRQAEAATEKPRGNTK